MSSGHFGVGTTRYPAHFPLFEAFISAAFCTDWADTYGNRHPVLWFDYPGCLLPLLMLVQLGHSKHLLLSGP